MGAGRCIDEINFQRRHFSTEDRRNDIALPSKRPEGEVADHIWPLVSADNDVKGSQHLVGWSRCRTVHAR
jgi:hypothetical protein